MPDDPVSTFKPEDSELNYRFFEEDLNTKEKLLAYLEEIYTKEASEKFVQDKFNSKSIIETAGKLARVDADAGSQLFWKDAAVVSSTKPNEQTNVTYT
ncbi:IseA DL-endopeptidase inhibitor family protein [Virgibacillus proomii]|uniref:IseA DL-endopeptidase inhibitor family protein n=1 Tax=Virgibacillus proomii TaxID=84407 RepID=UPI00209FB959|nr:IseA DL-endopeptidase inhibitor family protein [Virgibacillus proomii]